MTSQPMRDQVKDHLLTPKNSMLILLQVSPQRRALFNDTGVQTLGRLLLAHLSVVGQVQVLLREQLRGGHISVSGLDILAADVRNSPDRPHGYGVYVTYGPNDMVLDNWGDVDRWIAEGKVISYGPSGIGFVNFGTTRSFHARLPTGLQVGAAVGLALLATLAAARSVQAGSLAAGYGFSYLVATGIVLLAMVLVATQLNHQACQAELTRQRREAAQTRADALLPQG